MPGKLKSQIFEVGLLDKYHLFIPEEIFRPFAEAKQSRVKINASHKSKSIEFYAAVKKDKNTDDYKFMFSKEKQKQLGLLLNDYFKLQLFEDTSKYGVDMSEELSAVFDSEAEAFKVFESLTKGKQRSIIYAIARFKNSQTRIDKALVVCENLRRGNLNTYTILKQQ
ncbi:YdeI/OmpD-associated family protein [Ichthyenterobacterium sp. W332]|uniref:YdeI/OmpD-associated family protein n=1 Tax=Microcosmobacter mediterraneus TaxID=3075607 RepID=A0ABU2YLV7_9FLAO|nr:YdeI/OmpD-associated family protein [Ichthyenterobacterium sp. W332]MDT0559144.1 YdeI/OmpD-associated family protein [Ichthyenterobacterium sp. W332]